MSTWMVAKREILEAYHSKLVRCIGGLFIFILAVVGHEGSRGVHMYAEVEILLAPMILRVLIPLAALVLVFSSIAGRRESGSLRLLLAYSHSRADVFIGTFIGRCIIFCVILVLSLCAAAITNTWYSGNLPSTLYVTLALLSMVYALTTTGIIIGISAFTRTREWALGAGLGLYVFVMFGWQSLTRMIWNPRIDAGDPSIWFSLVKNINFFTAFLTAKNRFLIPSHGARRDELMREAASAAFYQSGWFALMVLVAWPTLLLALGLLQFRRADL
ncbi:ABC transporter permease [Haladaptatus caseinilyticus]|uniref:ABC transporter permease n=1 Tax=Haladaptatus caseinilyticus TaxID=2993314 RepID=UPI00224B64EE|nr:ABC transporter permease subunit [Haladaptatus caseinilyticus]